MSLVRLGQHNGLTNDMFVCQDGTTQRADCLVSKEEFGIIAVGEQNSLGAQSKQCKTVRGGTKISPFFS